MTIDAKTFKYWMAVIADRTGRALSAPTYTEYHRALSGELTTEQFVEAAALVFRNAEFWPAPRVFIEAVRPDPVLEGRAAFEWIRNHSHHNARTAYWDAQEIESELGAPALVAFRAIGGGERFAAMDGRDLSYASREYADAYVRAKADAGKPPATRMLPPPTGRELYVEVTQPALPRG